MLLEALTCPTNSTKNSTAKLIIFLTLINHLVATKTNHSSSQRNTCEKSSTKRGNQIGYSEKGRKKKTFCSHITKDDSNLSKEIKQKWNLVIILALRITCQVFVFNPRSTSSEYISVLNVHPPALVQCRKHCLR